MIAIAIVGMTGAGPRQPVSKPDWVPRNMYLPEKMRQGLGYSPARRALCEAQRGSKYLQNKKWILDSLECDLPALVGPDIWKRGSHLLNVGAGSGEMDTMWERKYGVNMTSIDVVTPEGNKWTLTSGRRAHHKIDLYDGHTLNNYADRSFDTVLFVSVLHHASKHAPNLLLEAGRVARKYVIILEDLGMDYMLGRHTRHDKRGIFRTIAEWHILMTSTRDYRMVMDSPVGNESAPCYRADHTHQITDRSDGTQSPNIGSSGCRAMYICTLVAQRVQS